LQVVGSRRGLYHGLGTMTITLSPGRTTAS
jgi:hypothetical protein